MVNINAIVIGGNAVLGSHTQNMRSVFKELRNHLETVVGSPCEVDLLGECSG